MSRADPYIILFLILLSIFIGCGENKDKIPNYDIVIKGGTVIDPESGLNEVMNVGIYKDKIVAVTKDELKSKNIIHAKDKYVVPGFIDVLSYGPYYYANLFKVADGVTTNLSLHGGTVDFKKWSKEQKKYGNMVNYGAAVCHKFMRDFVGVPTVYKHATQKQIDYMVYLAEKSLHKGALAVSFSLEYTPGATKEEIKPLFEVAAKHGVPCFLHIRYSDPEPPGTNEEAVQEVIDLAKETGAACHIDHITSTGGTFTMKETISQIEDAHKHGLDISACMYPYDFWGTYLCSARFSKGWQDRFRIDYDDLQIAGTEERVTEETFKQYQEEGKIAVAYAIPKQDVIIGLKCPWIMIGSDSIISSKLNSHPRGAGCFSRVIGKYVREEKVLSLQEAIGKMTLLPAQRVEKVAPQMKNKGRIRVGADADIVVFDFEKIKDRATVADPNQYSQGIEYVLINGRIVKKGNKVLYKPAGKLIKREIGFWVYLEEEVNILYKKVKRYFN